MSMPGDNKTKSFWERPEGTTGMATIAAIGAGVFFLGKAVLPTIIAVLGLAITAVGQAVTLAALAVVLGAILLVVTNGQFQTLVGYAFRSVMRKVTGFFMEIDPIGIMKNYIEDLKKRLLQIDDGISKLSGQVTICQRLVDKNTADADTALHTAAIAKKQSMSTQMTVQMRQAGRLQASNVTLKQLLTTMQMHLKMMRKYREVSDTIILDMQNEVELRSQERKMIYASYGAMKTAKRILNGDPDKKALFDQAMEYTANDYGAKLGEIENFINNSKSFVEGLDLQNNVFEADAMTKIQEWETKADSLLLPPQTINASFTVVSKEPVALPVGGDNDLNKFFH